MPEYKITWSMELSADSPQEAAEMALDCISFGTAKVFTVIEEGHLEGVDIDLDDTGEDS